MFIYLYKDIWGGLANENVCSEQGNTDFLWSKYTLPNYIYKCIIYIYTYMHTHSRACEGYSKSNATYSIMSAHNVRHSCWWDDGRGGEGNYHSLINPS